MSLESIQRRWLLRGLVLGSLVTGCEGGSGDENDDILSFGDSSVSVGDSGSSTLDAAVSVADAGKDAAITATTDSSSPAVVDAAMDSGTGTTMDTSVPVGIDMMCGATQCTGSMLGSVGVHACCVGGADAGAASCGLNADDLKKASPSSPFTGCVPKEVPQASVSAYCGEIWDQVETNGKDNGGLDLTSGDAGVIYDGCCLESGECGAYLREPRNMSGVDPHLGCVSFTRLREALTLPDAGTPPALTNQPFCNPTNGEAVTTGTVPAPKFVCGCGADTQPVAGAVPSCLGNLPKEVCGRNDPDAASLSAIPEYICGCSDNSKLDCLKNVAPTVCGTKAITANSTELDKLPEYICGCGPSALDPGGVIPCLDNVEANVCGKTNITNKDGLSALPEFLCGCGNNKLYDLEQVQCLSNVDAALCGGKDITLATDPLLTPVPEFMCGCGEAVPFNAQPFPCLSNVAKAVCGARDLTASTQPDLAKVPAFICGCGNGNLYDTELYACLSNVATDVCGGQAITDRSLPALGSVPTYRCGCTGATFQQPGCLANTQVAICGRAAVEINKKGNNDPADDCLVGIVEYVRGCGTTASPTTDKPTCLKGVADFPGCVDTEVDQKGTPETTDDCLKGVPEYQRGCGNGIGGPADASMKGCLPLADTFWGCVDITSPIPNIREYICGCGNGVAQPATPTYPCLSNVANTVCGAVSVTKASEIEGVENTVCGCGDGVVTGANCVRNVARGLCGAQFTCARSSTTNPPPAQYLCTRTCRDYYGTNSTGGQGDGIADTCE